MTSTSSVEPFLHPKTSRGDAKILNFSNQKATQFMFFLLMGKCGVGKKTSPTASFCLEGEKKIYKTVSSQFSASHDQSKLWVAAGEGQKSHTMTTQCLKGIHSCF